MKKVGIILAAAGVAICACAVTYTEKAADGVNEVTTVTDGGGNVVSHSTTLEYVPKKYQPPTDDETAEVREAMSETLRAAESKRRDEATDKAVAEAVYGERGSNSTFVTRKEMTPTQKRFVALGKRYYLLARAVQDLNRRVEMLEREREAANASGRITLTPTAAEKEGK